MVYALFDYFLSSLISRPILVLVAHLIILHSLPIEKSHLRFLNQALCLFLLI